MLKYGNVSAGTPGMVMASLADSGRSGFDEARRLYPTRNSLNNWRREDRCVADHAVDVIGRVDLARGIELRISEVVAILPAMISVRVAEEYLVVGIEVMVDFFVPPVPVQTSATLRALKIAVGTGPCWRTHLVGWQPDAQV